MENNDLSTMNGFFKDIYADKLQDLIPEGVKISKMIPFVAPSKRMGLEYKQPVNLSLEHGVTYGGELGEAFTLNTAIAGATREATVKGSEMVLRGRIAIGAISRSTANEAASFGRATKHVIKNLQTSSFKKHESQLMYGRSGLAVLTSPDSSVTGQAVTINDAEWAPGIWSGGEGMRVMVYNVSTPGTLVADTTITEVDFDNKAISLADVTGIQGALTNGDELAIYEYGSFDGTTHKAMLGLHSILTTTSGSVFGIPTTYSLWKGNQAAVNGVLTFSAIQKGLASAVAKGVEGKMTLVVNPEVWATLLDEQTSKRVIDSSYNTSEYKEGSEKIVFYSQNGIVEIIASTYCKIGFAYALNLPCFSRVGSSEITFKIPGSNEDFIVKPDNSHSLEFRTYCDLALFCDAIGTNVVYTGITLGTP